MPQNPYHWKHIVIDYFTFSKGQRKAVIVLLTAILLLVFVPAIYRFFFKPVTVKADAFTVEQVASLQVITDSDYFNNKQDRYHATLATDDAAADKDIRLFNFDPNTASFEAWQRLGLRDKTIRTIQNYLSKGGHFYKAEDLKKIYGFRENEAAMLMPYVRIAGASKQDYKNDGADKQPSFYSKANETKRQVSIDINAADSMAWIALPGIGPKLASRILNFRKKLGGFYSISQVGETYGVPDSTFQKIKPWLTVNPGSIHRKNINTATLDELKTPYIPYNVANAIIQYRTHNGNFSSITDLKKIPLIDEALYVKISPYLAVE